MNPRVRSMVRCVVVGVWLAPTGGHVAAAAATAAAIGADPDESPRSKSVPVIVANGACPTSETIWSAMASLVPRGALDALPRSAAVDVSDLGETYRVRLVTNGVERMRVYRDVARDCEQRARFAAVFIVLTLMPPELLIDTPRLPQPEPVAPAPLPPPPPAAVVVATVVEPPPRFLRLELAALGDAAPAVLSSPEITSTGGELRLSLGRGPLAGLVAIGLQPGTDFTVGALRARERRIALDAGARWRYAARWIEIGGEAGLAAALFRTEGLSPVIAKQATRVDLGLRGGVTVRFGARNARVAPIGGLHGTYFPRPYELATSPSGVIGRTPSFRVGASVGVAASF